MSIRHGSVLRVSLYALTLVVVIITAVSGWYRIDVVLHPGGSYLCVGASQGILSVSFMGASSMNRIASVRSQMERQYAYYCRGSRISRLGESAFPTWQFILFESRACGRISHGYCNTSMLLLSILGVALSALAFRGLHRRSCKHCCMRCGYDLTGNESGRCPECGDEVMRTLEVTAEPF